MNPQFFGALGAGLVLGISAIGAAIGIGITGSASIGAAKRCLKANQPVPMLMLTFAGFPLTQVIYGFIIMQQMINVEVTAVNAGRMFGIGVGGGLIMCIAGIFQGKVGASACDALGDTGKGAAFYIAVLGIIETVALFGMVFTLTSL